MKIENILNEEDYLKRTDFENIILKINLSIENLDNLHLKILKYEKIKLKQFILVYDFEKLKIPISKILQIILKNLKKIVLLLNIKIYFEGFPYCIYKRLILNPSNEYLFSDLFYFSQLNNKVNKLETCKFCYYNLECKANISNSYLEKFGNEEFKFMQLNKDFYNLYLNEINLFKSFEIKKIALEVLEDYNSSKDYLRKRFVLIKSYPDNLEESSKERFAYYIYNYKYDFENEFNFLINYFDFDFMIKIRDYLKKSFQFAFSFSLMGDNKLRKSFYFQIDNLNLEEILELLKLLNLNEISLNEILGIGIDFKEDKITKKIYYKKSNIFREDFNNFLFGFKREKFDLFINDQNYPLNGLMFDEKYKNENLYSKRIDISCQFNNLKFSQDFYNLFSLDKRKHELYTISFEFTKNLEKINIYYVLK